MATAKTKKTFVDPLDPFERGLEAVRSLSEHTKKGFKQESEKTAQEAFSQVFGMGKSSGEHPEATAAPKQTQESAKVGGRVEIFNAKHHKPDKAPVHADKAPAHADKAPQNKQEAAIDYHKQYSNEIKHSRERASKGEMQEMRRNIEQIKAELSKLVSSSEMLKLQFAEVGVEQTTPNVGTYQLNFFEWMLAVIRSARQKVEDSGAWLNTAKGKGQKGYWGMFKKHGTTFGLSGERSVATSVG